VPPGNLNFSTLSHPRRERLEPAKARDFIVHVVEAYRRAASWSVLICPKFSGDAKFVRLLDQATDIVTNDFTQDFINHRAYGS